MATQAEVRALNARCQCSAARPISGLMMDYPTWGNEVGPAPKLRPMSELADEYVRRVASYPPEPYLYGIGWSVTPTMADTSDNGYYVALDGILVARVSSEGH